MISKAKFIRWLYVWHKWTGALGGAFIFFLLLTGTVAVFKAEIDWAVTPALRIEPQHEKQPLEEMLGNVAAAFPGEKISNVSLTDDDATAYTFSLGGQGTKARTVFVNPYTAQVTGARQGETLANVIRQTHVRFYAFGANGRIVVGVFGLVLLLSSFTGLFIYAPFMRVVFRHNLKFWQLRQGFRAATSDAHKLIGVVTLLFNVILGLTGAVLGLENLAPYHPPTQALLHPRPSKEFKPQTLENRLSVDAAVERARQGLRDFKINAITLPHIRESHYVFTGDLSGRFERANASFVVVDANTGAILQTHSAAKVRAATWLYNLSEPLHFGDFSGLWLKALYFLFGAAGTALSVTGFVILIMRKRRISAAQSKERSRPVAIKVHPQAEAIE